MQKKQIMSDPVGHYSNLWPDNIDTLNNIKTLWQYYQSLDQQLKDVQKKAGNISRQIGIAKRDKQSTDMLITAMRTVSDERRSLINRIKHNNLEILSHFQSGENMPRQLDPGHNDHSEVHRYSSAPINLDHIHVSSFDKINNQDEWNEYISINSAANIHHRIEWSDIHAQSYGHESLYLCARNRDQNLVGILPLILIKSRLFGNKLVSMPYFQRGGAIADHPLIEKKLINDAVAYGLEKEIDYAEFRDDIPREHLPEPTATQTHKVNMILSLPDSHHTLWQGFTAKLRSQINRSKRKKPEVFIGRREYLSDFYSVYSRNMRDLGSPVQSKHFIDNILLQFPNNSWIIVIKLHHRPVAAGFLLGFKDTMEIPLASTIRDVNPLSINMLLYWEVLKFAIKQNYSQFDFGRSSKNAGTYKFKKQWGAQPKQLYWNYWLNHLEAPPSLNPSSTKYALIINVWKRLPMAVANYLGPAIVKNIP